MNAPATPPVGSNGWFDLTVEKAPQVRDFYAAVIGWKWSPVPMKGYEDYCMNLPDGGETVVALYEAPRPPKSA